MSGMISLFITICMAWIAGRRKYAKTIFLLMDKRIENLNSESAVFRIESPKHLIRMTFYEFV